ncbi:hypothetical protein [Methylomonas methanica]|uniref:hypothetical protein n=1 Tax=Methylomonas methanica TaxID=421 RepID=UPI0011D1A7FA|nr:hypothetical protein [Methylomonas methanica]
MNTDIQVKPSKSQVVLVSLIILSGICYMAGFLFLWENKTHAWVPLIIGTSIIIPSIFAWFKSQKDTDLENSKPTSFTDGRGNQIVTDTRALMSPEVVQNMERLFCTLTHREPLPEPDGILDKNGIPIPNTVDEARSRVDQANQQAQEIASTASIKLGMSHNSEQGVQPLIDEPYSPKIIHTNAGA